MRPVKSGEPTRRLINSKTLPGLMGRDGQFVRPEQRVGPILPGIDPDDVEIASQAREDVIAWLPDVTPAIWHHRNDSYFWHQRNRKLRFHFAITQPANVRFLQVVRG